MFRSATSKVVWVGKTASIAFGLALVVALVLGVTTVALAAVPGDPFRLGRINAVNAMTQLVGTTDSVMLKVDNNGTGSALGLEVEQGEPPMRVNSSKKVPNLNADKLDGLEAGGFATASEAAGFDYQDNGTSLPVLTETTQNIASITLTAPADGYVVLTGSGVFDTRHTASATGGRSFARIFLTDTSGGTFPHLTYYTIPGTAPSGTYSDPFSITRVFPVTAGENTFYMTGDAFGGQTTIVRHNLTGVFIKNQL